MQRRTLIGLAVALIAGIGAECATGGDKLGPHVDVPEGDSGAYMLPPDGPDDWIVGDNPMWGANICVWVEKAAGPWTVKVTVTDHTEGRAIQTGSWHVEYGRWTCPVSYGAHHDISFQVVVNTKKHAANKSYIDIREGGPRKKLPTCSTTFSGRKDVELVCNSKRK